MRLPFLEFWRFLQELQARVGQKNSVQHRLELFLADKGIFLPPQNIKQPDYGRCLQSRISNAGPMI